LNVSSFRNGVSIAEAQTAKVWQIAYDKGIPAWCYYNNDPANGSKYGKLYNWWAVNDPRGLAPKDWHIPSVKEWQTLVDYLGGDSVAGGKMKETAAWSSPNTGAAWPGGSRNGDTGDFGGVGDYAMFWSSKDGDRNPRYHLFYDKAEVFCHSISFHRGGYSVRCVKSGSGCFIATVAYGSSDVQEVNLLRDFRDQYLLKHGFGRAIVSLYEHISPPIAEFIKNRSLLRLIVRVVIIHPLIQAIKLFYEKRGERPIQR
jgi:uncharacterized protein (TIGR02145 family)